MKSYISKSCAGKNKVIKIKTYSLMNNMHIDLPAFAPLPEVGILFRMDFNQSLKLFLK